MFEMTQTAQLFELDNSKRFRKLWEECSDKERAEIYVIVRQEMGESISETLTEVELNKKSQEVINFLNEKTGKRFRFVDVHLKQIRARLKSGIEVQELKSIIARKHREWVGTDQEQYLRPATLFCEKNCENYLGELC